MTNFDKSLYCNYRIAVSLKSYIHHGWKIKYPFLGYFLRCFWQRRFLSDSRNELDDSDRSNLFKLFFLNRLKIITQGVCHDGLIKYINFGAWQSNILRPFFETIHQENKKKMEYTMSLTPLELQTVCSFKVIQQFLMYSCNSTNTSKVAPSPRKSLNPTFQS